MLKYRSLFVCFRWHRLSSLAQSALRVRSCELAPGRHGRHPKQDSWRIELTLHWKGCWMAARANVALQCAKHEKQCPWPRGNGRVLHGCGGQNGAYASARFSFGNYSRLSGA